MNVKDLRRALLRRPAAITQRTFRDLQLFKARESYVLMVDLRDGEPPRQVTSLEWDDEHRALFVSVG